MTSRALRPAFLALLAAVLAAPASASGDKVLHLAVGDPARRDREAPLVLDAITDTRTGDAITPDELARRLAGTRLLLLGEEHTSAGFHHVQLRVLQALLKAGRRVHIGLEMYPYTEQRALDQWRDGLLTEEGFLRLSRWYHNWGYNWLYYRDIFLLARDERIPMHAVNTPREVVSAVRKKGLANLTEEEAAHLPKEIDVDSADHLLFFKTTLEDAEGAMGMHGMSDEMWKNVLAAQCTWDATMGYNAVQAWRQANDPDAIMVVLVGSGHVAYGLGIERQARRFFDRPIASVIPVPVTMQKVGPIASTRASYANFTWGIPEEIDSEYPSLGISTTVGGSEASRRIIDVQKDTPAARAGLKVGDVLVSMDGAPIPDRETYGRLMAAKRWGDRAVFVVERGGKPITLEVLLRRTGVSSRPGAE